MGSDLGAILSLFALGVLALVLAALMRRRGQSRGAYVTAGLLCVVNPFTWEALRTGHPEELLGAALCVGAVLAARRNRTVGATVLTVGAVVLAGTQWAVIDPVTLLMAIPLTALWWFSPRRTPDDVLALVALLFLVASAFVPFLLALVAWEGLTRRGLPLASLLSSAAVLNPLLTVPIGMWLAVRLYVPSRTLPRLRAWPYAAPRVPVS
jgi:hypothetical protein